MSYTINVSRQQLERQWRPDLPQYVYKYYFRVNTDHCRKSDWNENSNNLDDMVAEFRSMYPSPKFKVSVYEIKSHSEEIEV